MSTLYPLFLLVGVGALIATQATLNAALGRNVGLALFALVFSIMQTVFAVPVLMGWGWPPRFGSLATTAWWHHGGSLLGVFILIGVAFGLARVGTFTAMICLIVGQATMGLAIDHFGWFGATIQPVTWPKLLGLAFLMAGIILVKQ